MALDPVYKEEVIKLLDEYIHTARPPVEIRTELDIGYLIEDQSVILVEIRPNWRDKSEYHRYPFAKATYVKSRKVWNVYWIRANLKWHLYEPFPVVRQLKTFLQVVEEDSHGCFKG